MNNGLLHNLSRKQMDIMDSMMGDNYIETEDGSIFWLVTTEHGYQHQLTESVKGLIARNIISPKKIDDDTTRYFLTEEAVVEMKKKYALRYNREKINSSPSRMVDIEEDLNMPMPVTKVVKNSNKDEVERQKLNSRSSIVKSFLGLK
jgi:hypothetical protein